MDPFAEALAVVPLVHLPVSPGQNVLLIGPGAGAAADVVLRYPTTASVLVIGDTVTGPAAKDRRIQSAPSTDQIPAGWVADLSIVVVPGLADALIAAVYAKRRPETGIAVFAVANPTQIKAVREQVKRVWTVVQPYREHVNGQMSWFLLAGEHGFKRHRPMPGWTGRLTDKYLPALFTFAKDEYASVFGAR